MHIPVLLSNYPTVHVVSIVNRYGLDSPVFDPQLGRDFPSPSRPTLESNLPPVQWKPGLFPSGKAAGASRQSPTSIQC
jgi:hypothetical protein